MAQPLTEDERVLLNTPDEEIHEKYKPLSFDTQRFKERITIGEPWQQLIQAHLYLDHTISLMIADALHKPSAINTGRMGFVQKLQLVEGMGLLRDDVISAIRVVNGLRNSIAHDLNFEICDTDVRNVVNAIPKFLREIMKAEKGRPKGPLSFVEALTVLTLHSEVERTRHIITRVMNKKGELRLRDVLNKTALPRKQKSD
jgi:hypothetical protein